MTLKRLLWLAPLVALMALAGLAALRLGAADPADTDPFRMAPDERPAPAGARETLDGGEPVDFSAPGRPVFVNLWASWCAPCLAEHPRLMALAETFRADMIGVLYDDTEANGRAFLADLGDPFGAIVGDPEGRLGLDFGITGVPESFLVSADGRIVRHFRGPLSEADARDIAAFLSGGD